MGFYNVQYAVDNPLILPLTKFVNVLRFLYNTQTQTIWEIEYMVEFDGEAC